MLPAAGHLLSNGYLRSILLFGTLGFCALLDMGPANRRGAALARAKADIPANAVVVIAGLGAWFLLTRLHGWLFGVGVVVF